MRTTLLVGAAAAFFGAFFAYTFDQFAKWIGDYVERRRRHKNALVKLEHMYAVQLNSVCDDIFVVDSMKSILGNTSATAPALSFNVFHEIDSDADVFLDLLNLDFVNTAFFSHIGIVKLNRSMDSLNRFYAELKSSLLAKNISPSNYQENVANFIEQLDVIRVALKRTEAEIFHLTGCARVLIKRKHWLDNLGPSLREHFDESTVRETAEQVALLQKEIQDRAPAAVVAKLMGKATVQS